MKPNRHLLVLLSFGLLTLPALAQPAGRGARGAPARPVVAGVERVTVMPGKTYLNGRVADAAATAVWSKESGPGEVTFANAHTAVTTATFSAPGEYVLKLAAGNNSDTVKVTVDPPAPAVHAQPFELVRYSLDSPLWSARAKALIVNWIPHCMDQLNNPNLRQGPSGIDNFVEAGKRLAGQEAAAHKGYIFSNAFVHNTVEAICVALMVDPKGDQEIIRAQEGMRTELERWIPIILAAQEPDGYIHTSYTIRGTRRWTVRGDHEGYVMGYFIEAGIAHYLMTGKKDARLYEAAKKCADCWYNNIGPAPKRTWYDGHQEMEQALVRLGRFVNAHEGQGKGSKYIELAQFLLEARRNGSEYDQSHLPTVQQYEAVGHAVRASYQYHAVSEIALATGNIDYHSAARSLWSNILDKKYYLTGGIGSGDTSEGFGPNYALRNNSYCESCSGCGQLYFGNKMSLLYNDAHYADAAEETFYNAILGDIDLAGRNFGYTNPLSGGNRTPWHGCPCCVGNIPRTLLSLSRWMYAASADGGLTVNMFIGSAMTLNVAGTEVEMVQKTDYPWSGNIAITVNPRTPKAFALRIRIPNRKTSALYTAVPEISGVKSVAVNGQVISPRIEKGYAVIERAWSTGDRVELVLPMEVQRVTCSELVAANRGLVALRYGPLVYNFEAADQPLAGKALGAGELKAVWMPDLLQGVVAIKGTWADGTELTAIPNYARLNRLGGAGARGGGGGGGGAGGPTSTVWIAAQQ